MKNYYYDLSGVAKYILILAFLGLLIACFSGCTTQHSTVKWVSKYEKVSCPKVPGTHHYVRRNSIKMQSPDICPAYRNPRKAKFTPMSNF